MKFVLYIICKCIFSNNFLPSEHFLSKFLVSGKSECGHPWCCTRKVKCHGAFCRCFQDNFVQPTVFRRIQTNKKPHIHTYINIFLSIDCRRSTYKKNTALKTYTCRDLLLSGLLFPFLV